MEDKALFRFQSKNPSLANFFWLLTLIIPFACLPAIIGSALLSLLVEELATLNLPSYFLLIVFGLFVLGILFYGSQNRLVSVIVDSDKLSWQTSLRKECELHRNEIHSARFDKKGRLLLNETHKIPIKGLPKKMSIQLGTILPQWLPEHSMASEIQEYVLWKRQLAEAGQENESLPVTAQSNRKRSSRIRNISFVGLSIFLGLLLWWIASRNLQEALAAIIPIGTVVFLLSFAIWESTKYQRIEIEERGIIYQRSRKELLFKWDEIEVLAFQVAQQRLLIWQGERYKSFSYSHINAEALNRVSEAIYQQAALRDIPIAKV